MLTMGNSYRTEPTSIKAPRDFNTADILGGFVQAINMGREI
jgi:hypothetical protein